MKSPIALLAFLLGLATARANLQTNLVLNEAIPDGDKAGMASTITLSGELGAISSLQVNLNISGTYNGDLYAYLVHDTGFSVLLNRVGVAPGNSLGFNDPGLNVTFSDTAANGDIHLSRPEGSAALSSPLTGLWAPDGRNVSPLTITGTEAPSAMLSSFSGLDPNGTWTLFVADVSGGDLNQLNSWGLSFADPVVVPEPVGLPLVGALAAAGLAFCRKKQNR